MFEHTIALRRAWDLHDSERTSRRIELPGMLPACPTPMVMSRVFQRPPLDPGSERLLLRLSDVPDLVAVRLNGCELEIEGSRRPIEWRLESDRLDRRNILELTVGPSEAPRLDWGNIVLVIRAEPDRVAARGSQG